MKIYKSIKMQIRVYLDKDHEFTFPVKSNTTITYIKQTLKNFPSPDIHFFINEHEELTVFSTDKYDTKRLKLIWNKLSNPTIFITKSDKNIQIFNNVFLIRAVMESDLAKVKDLIKQGADIHANSDYLLTVAVSSKYLPVVKYLVEQGADMDRYVDGYMCEISNMHKNSDLYDYILYDLGYELKYLAYLDERKNEDMYSRSISNYEDSDSNDYSSY